MCDSFYYNSTYAFSENKVTSHIELEGLESVWATGQDLWRQAGINSNTANKIVRNVNTGIQKAATISRDVLTIAGGVTVLVVSGGTTTPLFIGLSGSAAVTGGTMKLAFDISGNTEAAKDIPTTFAGSILYGVNDILQKTAGKKIFGDEVKTAAEFSEGLLTLKVTGIDKMSATDKASNVISAATLTLDVTTETYNALKKIFSQYQSNNNDYKMIPQAIKDHTDIRTKYIH